MNWEAVGAISQIVGTVLVGITLIYLAIQLRQNTSALKWSKFLAISTLMGTTMEIWATHPDLAPLRCLGVARCVSVDGKCCRAC